MATALSHAINGSFELSIWPASKTGHPTAAAIADLILSAE
jgi:hypothetical protein